MKIWVAAVLAGATILAGTPSASADEAKTRAQLQKAYEAARKDDCPTALKLLRPTLKAKAIAELPGELAALGYHLAAVCEMRGGRIAEARAATVAGTAIDAASDDLWRLRFGLELDMEDHAAATATVVAMSQGRGAALNGIELRWLYQLSRKLREAKQDALQLQLLTILTDPAFDPAEPLADKDGFRETLAGLMLDRGDAARARALVGEIESAGTLLDISFDRRLRAFLPGDFDTRKAVERDLERARAAAARYPKYLQPLTEGARSLRALGRPKEALALLESARAGGKSLSDYDDAGEWHNWWWDSVARTQEMLGDYDATVAAFAEGAKLGEDGVANVSQVINRAHSQNRFGRPAETLKTLAAAEGDFPVSPYGAMELRLARGCANAALGNATALAEDRAFMEARAKDHREALTYVLICMGDMDAAAKSLIAALDDPDQRAATLARWSDYNPPLPGEPVYSFASRMPELKARADVKAAIEQAGGTRRIALQPGEF
jgi:hypothetical protein